MSKYSNKNALNQEHFTELGNITRSETQKHRTLERLRETPIKQTIPYKYYLSLSAAVFLVFLLLIPAMGEFIQNPFTSSAPDNSRGVVDNNGEDNAGAGEAEFDEDHDDNNASALTEFPPSNPKGTVEIANNHYEMKTGEETWRREFKDGSMEEVMSDIPGITQIAGTMVAIKSEPEMVVTINFDSNTAPKLSAYIVTSKNEWQEVHEEVPIENNQLILPTEEGRYIYEIRTFWTMEEVEGEVSYTFITEVE